MKFIIRTTLFAALAFIALPLCAVENDLEKRVTELEKRVSELESVNKIGSLKSPETSIPGNWKDIKNWRQLRPGMSYDEVRSLLGEPNNVDGGTVAHWYWGNGDAKAVFVSNKLHGWTEPR